MSEWEGKSKGNAIGYKIFIFIIKNLGLTFSYIILRFVALYFYFFSIKEKKEIKWYFKEIHKFGSLKSNIYIYKSFYAIGVSLLDKIGLLSNSIPDFSINHDGEKYLHELAESNQGGIIVGAHIGNWEIAGQLMKRVNVKVNIVMKLNEHEAIDSVMKSSTDSHSFNIINISDDFSYLIEIKKALDNNEFIILHGDRFVDESNVVEMDFMEKKALFPKGPFLLSIKFRKPIVFAFAMKESRKHYHFYASKPIYNNKRVNPVDVENKTILLVEQYIKNLEPLLVKHPEQWFNFYKFWK